MIEASFTFSYPTHWLRSNGDGNGKTTFPLDCVCVCVCRRKTWTICFPSLWELRRRRARQMDDGAGKKTSAKCKYSLCTGRGSKQQLKWKMCTAHSLKHTHTQIVHDAKSGWRKKSSTSITDQESGNIVKKTSTFLPAHFFAHIVR